jgi:hypothetical protein
MRKDFRRAGQPAVILMEKLGPSEYLGKDRFNRLATAYPTQTPRINRESVGALII